MNYSAITLLMLLSVFFALRLILIFVWKFNPSDALTHQYDARAIELNGGRIPSHLSQFYPTPQFSYPWAGSWLIYKFKILNPVIVGTIFNTFVSSIQFFLLYVLVLAGAISELGFLVGAIILVVAPNCVGPLMSVFGWHGRIVGSVAMSVLITLAILMAPEISPFYFVLYAILYGFIFYIFMLFSQFAVQSFFVLLMPLFLLENAFVVFAAMICGFCLVVFLSPSMVITILRGHINHVVFYRDILQYRHRSVSDNVFSLTGYVRAFRKSPSVRQALSLALYTPLVRCLAFAPWLLLLPLLLFAPQATLDNVTLFCCSLVVMSLLCIPIINVKGLRFLGESDRYFYFVGEFASIILIGKLVETDYFSVETFAAIVGFCILVYLIFVIARSKFSPDVSIQEFKEAGNSLKGQEGRALCVPNNYSEGVALFCDIEFVGLHSNVSWEREKWSVYDRLFPHVYPYPIINKSLYSELNIQFIVVAKKFCDKNYLLRHGLLEKLLSDKYNYDDCGHMFFENKDFVIYQVT